MTVFIGRNGVFVVVTSSRCYRSKIVRITNDYGRCYTVTLFSRGVRQVGGKRVFKPVAGVSSCNAAPEAHYARGDTKPREEAAHIILTDPFPIVPTAERRIRSCIKPIDQV